MEQNKQGKIVLLIFLLICGGLGIAAFTMSFTRKCGEGFAGQSCEADAADPCGRNGEFCAYGYCHKCESCLEGHVCRYHPEYIDRCYDYGKKKEHPCSINEQCNSLWCCGNKDGRGLCSGAFRSTSSISRFNFRLRISCSNIRINTIIINL